jgi:hypothetical protein
LEGAALAFKIPVPVPALVLKKDEIVTCFPDFLVLPLESKFGIDGGDENNAFAAASVGVGSGGNTRLVLVDLLVGDADGEGDIDLGRGILLLLLLLS